MAGRLRLYYDLFKLRIGLVIGVTALVGVAITGAQRYWAWPSCSLRQPQALSINTTNAIAMPTWRARAAGHLLKELFGQAKVGCG
jgi:hypothetical protein